MSRVLFLTQVLPYPLNAGPKVRAYYMLRRLSARHEVTLVSFVRADDSEEAVRELRPLCAALHTVPIRRSLGRNLWAGARALLDGLPVMIARDDSLAMRGVLGELVRTAQFDVVQADQLYMAPHGLFAAAAAAAAAPRRPRTVLDEHNANYVLARRVAATEPNPVRRAIAWREARTLVRYEAAACRSYDEVVTVTCEDRDRLLELYGPAERPDAARRFTVVPIGVDPAQPPVTRRKRAPVEAGAEGPVILHLGTMFWPPNVTGVLWFAREVLPLIWQQAPAARFVIAGKAPPPEVRALAADPRIAVTGYVADPVPYIETADAFVVPLHAGGGMRVKILDAWLWGLPIVSTPLGAEGIVLADGENVLLAGDAPQFAAATLRVLQEPELNARLRRAGRAWVESHYAWQEVYKKVDGVYDRLLNDRSAAPSITNLRMGTPA